LCRRGQGQRAPPAIVFGETGTGLEGDRRLAVEPETAADPQRCCRHCCCDISARKLSPRQDVRSRLLMQERSILFGSLLGVDNNLERFVGDLDLIERVFCERPSLAQDRDDGSPT
jgi:hypothetical protein